MQIRKLATMVHAHKIPEFSNLKMLLLGQRAALQSVPRYRTYVIASLMKAFSSRGFRRRYLPE